MSDTEQPVVQEHVSAEAKEAVEVVPKTGVRISPVLR